MSRVFISHSTKDRSFVEKEIIKLLNCHGIDNWYSKDNIQTADQWERSIVKGLESCDWFLIVMSPNSAGSEWVKDEVHWAMENRPGKIIPVLIANCEPRDLHLRMSRIQYVDFRSNLPEARTRLLATWGLQTVKPNIPVITRAPIVEVEKEMPVALQELKLGPGGPGVGAVEITEVPTVPAPQVAPSDLPPLPQDVLALEGRLNGLRQTIDNVKHGRHPDLRAGWKALKGHTTSDGQPLLESLTQRIEKNPSCRDSELCALSPDAPQWAVLVIILALKRLVELKRECAKVEQKLARLQEEDFRGILARFLAQSEEKQFPLAAWMRLEPLLASRRYIFVGNVRDLLRKAEEHFAAICEERAAERRRLEQEKEQATRQQEAERLRLEREKEQTRQQEEAERLRLETEQEQSRQQREKQAVRTRQNVAIMIVCPLLGAIALGLVGTILGALSWQGVLILYFSVGLLSMPFVLSETEKGCGCLFFSVIFGILLAGGRALLGSSATASNIGLFGGLLGLVVGLGVGGAILAKRADQK